MVAQQELQSALLLSLLTKYRIVPFFTEIYSLFHASYKPSFLSVFRESNHYLYTRMELANQGDLEGYLHRHTPQTSSLLQIFLQMVLSLYTAFHSVRIVHRSINSFHWFIMMWNYWTSYFMSHLLLILLFLPYPGGRIHSLLFRTSVSLSNWRISELPNSRQKVRSL